MFNINEVCDWNFLYKKDIKSIELNELKQLTLSNIVESDEYKRIICMNLPSIEFTMDYENSKVKELYINKIDWIYEIKENRLYPLSLYVDLEFFNSSSPIRLSYPNLLEKIGTKIIVNTMRYYDIKNQYIIVIDNKFSEIIFKIPLHVNQNIYFGSKITSLSFMNFLNCFDVLLCNSQNITLLGVKDNIEEVLARYNKSSFKNEKETYKLKLYLANQEALHKVLELAKLGYKYTDVILYSDILITEEELTLLSNMFCGAYCKIN